MWNAGADLSAELALSMLVQDLGTQPFRLFLSTRPPPTMPGCLPVLATYLFSNYIRGGFIVLGVMWINDLFL